MSTRTARVRRAPDELDGCHEVVLLHDDIQYGTIVFRVVESREWALQYAAWLGQLWYGGAGPLHALQTRVGELERRMAELYATLGKLRP